MKTKTVTRSLSVVLCMVLIAGMALLAGCGDKQTTATDVVETTFTFTVVDQSGQSTSTEITTTKATVGEALQEKGLIDGEESSYGLYVKTVNGITADYDTTGTYWAFYVNDQMASVGCDQTPVKDGETYSFKVEK